VIDYVRGLESRPVTCIRDAQQCPWGLAASSVKSAKSSAALLFKRCIKERDRTDILPHPRTSIQQSLIPTNIYSHPTTTRHCLFLIPITSTQFSFPDETPDRKMPSLADFFRAQFLVKIPKPTTSFESKTVIITGANGGLGLEISKHILRLGVQKLILACRSRSRGEAAKQQLEALFKCGPDTIEVWELDIESPESIRKFVDQTNALPRLDVVIHNAGIQSPTFKVVYDTERNLAINTIGTFLLALQLIPKLKETAQKFSVTPHSTIVSSALYDVANYPEPHGDDLFTWFKDPANFNMMGQ